MVYSGEFYANPVLREPYHGQDAGARVLEPRVYLILELACGARGRQCAHNRSHGPMLTASHCAEAGHAGGCRPDLAPAHLPILTRRPALCLLDRRPGP